MRTERPDVQCKCSRVLSRYNSCHLLQHGHRPSDVEPDKKIFRAGGVFRYLVAL
jgi:hypothetical protein